MIAIQGTETSRQLCAEISAQTGGICLLGFSRGKDSICAWLWLREFFTRIIPFCCASIPHLGFVDRSLEYYERVFETKILRMISGDSTGGLAALWYQPLENEPAIDAMSLYSFTPLDIAQVIRWEYGLPDNTPCAFGISATDNILRRTKTHHNTGWNQNVHTFYPCFDWSRKMILDTIRKSGVRLPPDYLMANRSFSGVPGYRNLCRLESVYPEDMRKVETMFPFIRAQLARCEFRAEKAAVN